MKKSVAWAGKQYNASKIDMATMTEEIIDDLERQVVYNQEASRFAERSKESVPLPWSYEEIRNLLWMRAANTDPVYLAALEEWERKEKKFLSRSERKSKESAGLQTEIYSLIGFYSVFQGVVLVAVSQAQPTVLQCRKFWIPVVLSVLASVVTFAGILQKHSEIKELKTSLRETFCCLEKLRKRQENLRSLGPKFRFAEFEESQTPREIGGRSWAGWSKFAFVWITFVAFAVVLPVFHWVLLCA